MGRKITKTDLEIIEAIKNYHMRHGFYPSVRDICCDTHRNSSATIQAHIEKLKYAEIVSDEGYRIPRAYALLGKWENGACSICNSKSDTSTRFCPYCGSFMEIEK